MAVPATRLCPHGRGIPRHRQPAATRRTSDTRAQAERAFGDSVHRPYLHLVDGGVSDNVGMRGVLDALEIFKRCTKLVCRRLSTAQRIIVFIVNSLSSPRQLGRVRTPPGTVDVLLKSAGTDRRVLLRNDQLLGTRRRGGGPCADPQFGRLCAQQGSCGCRRATRAGRRIYTIDVSFPR
jgi:NTE family protein